MSPEEFKKLLESNLGVNFSEDAVSRHKINLYSIERAQDFKSFIPEKFEGIKEHDLATAISLVLNKVLNDNDMNLEILNKSNHTVKFGLN
jgi:hypothetical protein